MKIGIMGTRGIPNRYGGFERFAEQLSIALAERGHEVYVYNSSLHEYREKTFKGVNIIHCRDKEDKWGTAGQFVYDLNCIKDARGRMFDVLLHLGYTSDSIWWRRWPGRGEQRTGSGVGRSCLNVVNMDGLEWKRKKYGWLTRQFLKQAERWTVRGADVLVADNVAIKEYLEKKYGRPVSYIPYPVEFSGLQRGEGAKGDWHPGSYFLVIARMEKENNIEMIIEGVLKSGTEKPLVIVGNANNKYGKWLKGKYEGDRVRFPGGIYDKEQLDELRYGAAIYFHGHSVGGTNPSLLEAMACGCPIAAHGNEFNKAVLGEKGFYFESPGGIADLITSIVPRPVEYDLRDYSLKKVVDAYEACFVTF